MSVSVLGYAVQRSEDPALLLGTARYVADLEAPDALVAHFVRSDVAHGRIVRLDLEAAREAPGVVAVLGATDLALPPLPEQVQPPNAARLHLARPCLASDRVRFVGEAVAVVVARSQAE